MPHRRPVRKGSFGSHFDELVAKFPACETPPPSQSGCSKRSQKLQDKIDIHTLLFELAWKLEGEV